MKSTEEIKADYHLFIDIQMGKYLKSVNKSVFSNDAEAKLVIDKVIEAYNQKVASDHLRLDNLNNEAKAGWFNSLEIDFGDISQTTMEFKEDYGGDLENVFSAADGIFPFLPKGASTVLIFAGPALEAFGLPFERFKELVLGEEPTEIEEDLILWAYEVTLNIMGSIAEYSKVKRKKAFEFALQIAQEELDKETALDVVQEIQESIVDAIGKAPKKSEKKKKK